MYCKCNLWSKISRRCKMTWGREGLILFTIFVSSFTIMYLKRMITFNCLTMHLVANQILNSINGQGYQKIRFSMKVWNRFSSKNTEELIINDALNSGIIECGLACHIKAKCGGFHFDQTSGSCFMKKASYQLKYSWYLTMTDNIFNCSFCVYKIVQFPPKLRILWRLLSKLKDFLNAWDMVFLLTCSY